MDSRRDEYNDNQIRPDSGALSRVATPLGRAVGAFRARLYCPVTPSTMKRSHSIMFISNVNRAQRFRARQATFSRLDHRLLMKLDMSKAREGQRVTKPCGTRRAAYRPDCGVLQGPAALTARRRKQLLFDREMDYVDIPLDHKIRGKVLSAVSGSMTAPRRVEVNHGLGSCRWRQDFRSTVARGSCIAHKPPA